MTLFKQGCTKMIMLNPECPSLPLQELPSDASQTGVYQSADVFWNMG